MRIFHTLAWALVALACAAPNCDTHDAPLGSGSGSSAWARMPSPSSGATSEPAAAESGSAVQHETVVHAMESVTGAALETPKSKPAKSRPAAKHASSGDDSTSGGGNYGRSSSSSSPPPPPKPELPETGRKLGQACQDDDQCATNNCEFDVCAKKHYMDKVTNGEACSYDHDCVSDRCYHDICETR
jgi:hypothetical protein